MPINPALAHLYGEPNAAPEPAAALAADADAPAAAPPQSPETPAAGADPSRLEQAGLLTTLILSPAPSRAEFAQALPGRPRGHLNKILAELGRNEEKLLHAHLGNATGWDPRWFYNDAPGEENTYKKDLMFRPETYYHDAESQIPRLLALDKIEHYQTAFAAQLEIHIQLRERLLAAYRALARPPDPEAEARIRAIGAVYRMTPLTAAAAASPYYKKMTHLHADYAWQALHPEKKQEN